MQYGQIGECDDHFFLMLLIQDCRSEHVKFIQHKNCAFVQFMDLQSALNAHQSAQGINLRGFDLRVGWGRVICHDSRLCRQAYALRRRTKKDARESLENPMNGILLARICGKQLL